MSGKKPPRARAHLTFAPAVPPAMNAQRAAFAPFRCRYHRPPRTALTTRAVCRCSMGNGMCQCAEGDTRCNTVKPFFEQSLEVCNSQTVGTCGNNLGYKSCSLKADQSCVATACWLATVDVIAACPEFYPDLSEYAPPRGSSSLWAAASSLHARSNTRVVAGSSPLSVCNTSDVGVYVKGTAYTYTTYEQDRDAEIFGGCTESHGECTERCGTKFNALWDDGECRPWLEAYANRAPVLKDDLKIFVDRCDVRRTGAGSWLLYGALISCLGACMLGTVISACPPPFMPSLVARCSGR